MMRVEKGAVEEQQRSAQAGEWECGGSRRRDGCGACRRARHVALTGRAANAAWNDPDIVDFLKSL